MMELFITHVPSQNGHVRTLKQIRQVLQMTRPEASMQDAQTVWGRFMQNKTVAVGEFESNTELEAARSALEDWGYESKVATVQQAVEPVEEALPEPVVLSGVQETSLVLMANCGGDPLRAAAMAIALSRVTGSEPLYEAVVLLLRNSFPWLTKMLVDQDLLVKK